MIITLLLSVMMMAGLFLLLVGGVGSIQDKRFFSSAPQQVIDAVPEHRPERFKGQHAVGWVMIVLVLGAWDGIRNGFTFRQFAGRFMTMLCLLKAFDVIFFDWVLLSNAGLGLFPYYYPETKTVLGRHLFGYNKKTHIAHVIGFIPGVALLSWICTLL